MNHNLSLQQQNRGLKNYTFTNEKIINQNKNNTKKKKMERKNPMVMV